MAKVEAGDPGSHVVELFSELKFRAYACAQGSSAVMYTRIPNSRRILCLRAHLREGTMAGYSFAATVKGAEIAGPEVPPLQDLFACPMNTCISS